MIDLKQKPFTLTPEQMYLAKLGLTPIAFRVSLPPEGPMTPATCGVAYRFFAYSPVYYMGRALEKLCEVFKVTRPDQMPVVMNWKVGKVMYGCSPRV